MPSTDYRGSQNIGIDFGMNSTVIAVNNGDGEGIHLKEFPGCSRLFPLDGKNNNVPVIPSLIHYDDKGSILIGEEVFSQNGGECPVSARWMKQYILQNSPARFSTKGGRATGFRQAATDFLKVILSRLSGSDQKDWLRNCESVFTFPVDAPSGYINWLEEMALSAGFKAYHLIDEAYAASVGYGLNPQSGCRVLILEFGQDGLDVKIVAINEENPHLSLSRSRVLGRAENNFGGSTLDACILQQIYQKGVLPRNGPVINKENAEMLRIISRMKEKLSQSTESPVYFRDPVSGREIRENFRRFDLDCLFEEEGISDILNRTIERALATAQMRGCEECQINAVLMIGECSNLPPVKETVMRKFGNIPVLHDHPVDAVARGAAMYTPSALFPNRIRNDYALRYWDPAALEHRYRFLVRTGARYPSSGQVARIIISASYDSQTRMGIPIYEICRGNSDSPHSNIELVSDSRGGIRIAGSALDADVAGKPVWINERTPMILVASPPAQKSEPRFELTFTIDRKRNLCVTVRDISTGLLIKTDAPLVRMT